LYAAITAATRAPPFGAVLKRDLASWRQFRDGHPRVAGCALAASPRGGPKAGMAGRAESVTDRRRVSDLVVGEREAGRRLHSRFSSHLLNELGGRVPMTDKDDVAHEVAVAAPTMNELRAP
jgi:hypothetical protein